MSFDIVTTSSGKKTLKKLPPQIRDSLVRQIQVLADNPESGSRLTGILSEFRSLHIKINNVQYRVAYVVHWQDNLVVVFAVGTRENFYKELEHSLR